VIYSKLIPVKNVKIMKTSIKLTAMALFLSAGAFAASPKPNHHKTDMNMDKPVVSIIPLKDDRGFAARIDKMGDVRSVVIVYNNDGDAIFKDRLNSNRMGEKKYLLRDLDDGKYTLEVYSKGRDVKTNFFIYYNTNTKRRVVDIM
jgi:hypothetical protein